MTTEDILLPDGSPQARLDHYRRMAAEAIKNAEACKDAHLRSTYLDIAVGWKLLAANTERFIRRAQGQD